MRQYRRMDDLHLAIQNIIRFGTIRDVMYSDPPRVRVKTGDLITNWIPWLTLRAGQTKTWSPLTLGEQVVLLSPHGDLTGAIALGGIYSDMNPTPSNDPNKIVVSYPDGAKTEYDHASGDMQVTGIKTLTVVSANKVTVNTSEIELNASSKAVINAPNVVINGVLSQTGGSATVTANMVVKGSLKQIGGELSSNGVVLDSHVHGGVQSGGSKTGAPQ